MSAITADGSARLAPRGPGRALQPSIEVAIRLVLVWHVSAALVFAWIAWNIFGAVWQLESVPRTAIHRPVSMFMLSAVVVLLGSISLVRLPVDLMPDTQVPTITCPTTSSIPSRSKTSSA